MITPEELRLAENITTRQWRDIYQPEGLRFRDYQGPDTRRAGRVTVAGAGQLQADSRDPCTQPLCEAQV